MAAPSTRDCVGDGNLIRVTVDDRDAPVVVLREYNSGTDWGGTFALWADGTVRFDPIIDTSPAPREVRIDPADVEALRARLLTGLADKPRRLEIGRRHLDGVRVRLMHGLHAELFVRDPHGWRIVLTSGVWRDDALHPPPPDDDPAWLARKVAEWNAIRGDSPSARNIPGPTIHDRPPSWFLAVYRTLLDAMPAPTAGHPWVPHAFGLDLLLETRRRASYGASMPWPADLPRPPANLELERCGPEQQDCRFMLPARFRDAALRLLARHVDDQQRIRPNVDRGHDWFVVLRGRYRGQDAIASVEACVEHLDAERGEDEP